MRNFLNSTHLFVTAFLVVLLATSLSVAEERIPMTNDRLDELLRQEFGDKEVEGGERAWRIVIPADDEQEKEDSEDDDAEDKSESEEDESKRDAAEEEGNETDAENEKEDGYCQEPEKVDGESILDDEELTIPGSSPEERLPPVMLVLTDSNANRMRMMMPIRKFDPNNVDDLRLALIALQSNYDRALDARYATQDGILWSVFIHPLESLTADDLKNGLDQVRALRRNTGTTFTSSELLFGVAAPQAQPEAQPN